MAEVLSWVRGDRKILANFILINSEANQLRDLMRPTDQLRLRGKPTQSLAESTLKQTKRISEGGTLREPYAVSSFSSITGWRLNFIQDSVSYRTSI